MESPLNPVPDLDAIKRQKAKSRLILAYKRTFETEEGKAVLKDLNRMFATNEPAFRPAENYSPTIAAIRDGERTVILHIENILNIPVEADGNIQKPKTKVIKPRP